MKKLIYSALILYAILFKISLTFQKPIPLAHNLNEIKKTISYIGFVKLPPAFKNAPLEQCPAPRIYYGGMVLPVSKTYDNDDCPLFSYTCPHITHATQIDIVIALIGSPTSITISSLEVPKEVPYVYYQLTSHPTSRDKKIYEWSIKETRSFGPFTIPNSAIIISEDADLIKKINFPIDWNKEGISVILPTIEYLDIEKELFEYAHNAGLLASLDIDGFHKKEEWVILQSPKNRIFKTRTT